MFRYSGRQPHLSAVKIGFTPKSNKLWMAVRKGNLTLLVEGLYHKLNG